MYFGVCWTPGLEQMGDRALLSQFSQRLKDAGADYLEFSASGLLAETKLFDSLCKWLDDSPLPVPALNGFIPGSYRLVGPDADHTAALAYCRNVLERAQRVGVDVIVLGSAGARCLPDGFSRKEGEAQFCQFCRDLGPVADAAGIDIAIEPLNSQEDNLILTVAHGARLVDEIAHPRIRLLADLYHMAMEKESMQAVADAGPRLRHTHLADRGRVAPGYAKEGEEDFDGFFRALRAAGYVDGPHVRCSFEGKTHDLLTQAPHFLSLLRERWTQSDF